MDNDFIMNWSTAVSLLERDRTFRAGRVTPATKRVPKMSLGLAALLEVSGHIDRFVEPDVEVPVVTQQRGWRWLCMSLR
jgi:hypothetical protein